MATTPREKRGVRQTGLTVQTLATVGAFGMIAIDQYSQPRIDPLFIWAMFGLAYGARPETVTRILRGGR